jgi:DNA repair protein RadC
MAHHGGLRGLFRLDVAELARVRGIGDAKAVRVKAALELGRRLAALSPEERPPVGSPEDVANLLGIEMAAPEQEQLRVVLLDTKHRILGTRTVYQGSVNQVRVADTILTETDVPRQADGSASRLNMSSAKPSALPGGHLRGSSTADTRRNSSRPLHSENHRQPSMSGNPW